MWKQFFVIASFLYLANAGWVQTWADEFNDQQLDTSKWNIGFGKSWNEEKQQYVPDAYTFTGSTMKIIAERQEITTRMGSNSYTSGSINTAQKYSQTYGYWEMRAKTPYGSIGFWPAFWLMDNSWTGQYNEIDIVEQLSKDPSVIYTTYHTGDGGNDKVGQANTMPNWDPAAFHTYAVQWIPNLLLFYCDGVNVWNHTNPLNLHTYPKYVLVNMAIGASWGGDPNADSVFPNYMEVDYVRIYSYSSNAGVSLPGPGAGISFTPEPQLLPNIYLKGFTVTPTVVKPGDTVTITSTLAAGDPSITQFQVQWLVSKWSSGAGIPNPVQYGIPFDQTKQSEVTVSGTFVVPADYSDPYIAVGHGLFNHNWQPQYYSDIDTFIGVNHAVGYSTKYPSTNNPTSPPTVPPPVPPPAPGPTPSDPTPPTTPPSTPPTTPPSTPPTTPPSTPPTTPPTDPTPTPPSVPSPPSTPVGTDDLTASSGVWKFETPTVNSFEVGTPSGKWRATGAAGLSNGGGYEAATHDGQYAFIQGKDSSLRAKLSVESNYGEWMMTWMESGRVAGKGGNNYNGEEPYSAIVSQGSTILANSAFNSTSSSDWKNRTVSFIVTEAGSVSLVLVGTLNTTVDSSALIDNINVAFVRTIKYNATSTASATTANVTASSTGVVTASAVANSALAIVASFALIAILCVF